MHLRQFVSIFVLGLFLMTGCSSNLFNRSQLSERAGNSVLVRAATPTTVYPTIPPVDLPSTQPTVLLPTILPTGQPTAVPKAALPTNPSRTIPPTPTPVVSPTAMQSLTDATNPALAGNPAPTAQVTPTATVMPTDLQPSASPTQDLSNAGLPGGTALRQGIAFLLDAKANELSFISLDRRDWPDSCLGLTQSGENCCLAVTAGYNGLVQYKDQLVAFHSDLTGENIRLVPLSGNAAGGESRYTTPNASPTIQPTPAAAAPTLEATASPTIQPAVLVPAQIFKSLADHLNIRPDRLVILDLNQSSWPEDLCTNAWNLPAPICSTYPSPGYTGLAQLKDVQFGGDPMYIFHSDAGGKTIYTLPAAALAARDYLAAQLHTDAAAIQISSVVPWSWPDTCSLSTPGSANTLCIRVPLPGWRIVLTTGQQSYIFHTDLNGEFIQESHESG